MQAANKPDFSGIWQLAAANSHIVGRPVSRMVVKIDHRDPTLVQMVVATYADGTARRMTFEFVTSGEESVNGAGPGQMRTRASWEGEELLVESWLALGEHTAHFRDYWLLSNSGSTLTMEHRDDDLAGQIAVLERELNGSTEFDELSILPAVP